MNEYNKLYVPITLILYGHYYYEILRIMCNFTYYSLPDEVVE